MPDVIPRKPAAGVGVQRSRVTPRTRFPFVFTLSCKEGKFLLVFLPPSSEIDLPSVISGPVEWITELWKVAAAAAALCSRTFLARKRAKVVCSCFHADRYLYVVWVTAGWSVSACLTYFYSLNSAFPSPTTGIVIFFFFSTSKKRSFSADPRASKSSLSSLFLAILKMWDIPYLGH